MSQTLPVKFLYFSKIKEECGVIISDGFTRTRLKKSEKSGLNVGFCPKITFICTPAGAMKHDKIVSAH